MNFDHNNIWTVLTNECLRMTKHVCKCEETPEAVTPTDLQVTQSIWD